MNALTGEIMKLSSIVTDPVAVQQSYARNVGMHGSLVHPRYLTLFEYLQLPDGAIELYRTSAKKDVDILRDQLLELNNGSFSSDQINADIYTIRDRVKCIPCVPWRSSDQIAETVITIKTVCQAASLPTETVVISISRATAIDYLASHCDDSFVAGALRAFGEYVKNNHQLVLRNLIMLLNVDKILQRYGPMKLCVSFILINLVFKNIW